MPRLFGVALASVAHAALLLPSVAFAQAAPTLASVNNAPPQSPTDAQDTGDDIVVTASRQGAQTLIAVPLAIQAFTGAQLEQRGIRDTTDLVSVIPGASSGEQVGSVLKTFTLRGIGAAGGVGDSPIGYYIDSVPFAVPNFPLAPPLRFVDIDRVEVLRGPQGTLYGQGSAGGTIIYHTRDPNLNEIEFRGEASVGKMDDASDLNYGASGAISIPLVKDRLAIRVSGGYDKRAGYVDVYSGLPTGPRVAKDANDVTNRDIRAVLLWKPTEGLTIRAQAAHWEPQQDYTQSLASLDPPQLWFTGTTRGYERGNFDLYSLAVDYDLGPAVLTSSTSILDAKFGYLTGQDFGPLGVGRLSNDYAARSFAQEVQLRSAGKGPFHWVLGGFYQNAKDVFSFDAATPVITISGFNDTRTRNYSAFGEISYDLLGGKIVPLLGIRYYKDDRRYIADSILTGSGSGETKPSKVTWRANISFFPTSNITAFVTVSTGFRSGITQTPFQVSVLQTANVPASVALNPDTLTNYELGLKGRFADGSLQVGLNLYRIDFRDLQLGLSPFGISAFANVGSARTTGIDAEIHWRTPIRGLNINAVANWNDSKFVNVVPAVTAGLPSAANGKRLSNTANYNYRVDADYQRPIGRNTSLFVDGSAARTGSRIMFDGYVVPAYSLYNASLGVRHGPWEVSLFGENLADERGPSFVRNSLLFAGPNPRTIGLRLRINTD